MRALAVAMSVLIITVSFLFILYVINMPVKYPEGISSAQEAVVIRSEPAGGWYGVFDEPRVFSSGELEEIIAVSPHYTQTRLYHPEVAMTDIERRMWISEYNALGGINAQEFELYKIVNEIRAQHGLPPFVLCPKLSMAARMFSYIQVRYQSSGHVDPYYGDMVNRMNFFGIYGTVHMENANSERWYQYTDGSIEFVYLSPQELVDGWMDSEAHREHILTNETTHAGFGVDSGNNRVVPTMKTILPLG
jgi:uncharacterized protein YkwD